MPGPVMDGMLGTDDPGAHGGGGGGIKTGGGGTDGIVICGVIVEGAAGPAPGTKPGVIPGAKPPGAPGVGIADGLDGPPMNGVPYGVTGGPPMIIGGSLGRKAGGVLM